MGETSTTPAPELEERYGADPLAVPTVIDQQIDPIVSIVGDGNQFLSQEGRGYPGAPGQHAGLLDRGSRVRPPPGVPGYPGVRVGLESVEGMVRGNVDAVRCNGHCVLEGLAFEPGRVNYHPYSHPHGPRGRGS